MSPNTVNDRNLDVLILIKKISKSFYLLLDAMLIQLLSDRRTPSETVMYAARAYITLFTYNSVFSPAHVPLPVAQTVPKHYT